MYRGPLGFEIKMPELLTAHRLLELVYDEAAPTSSESSSNLLPSAEMYSVPPLLIEKDATREYLYVLDQHEVL